MNRFLPEGALYRTQENRSAFASVSALREAISRGSIVEARASKCDKDHNIHIDLGIMEGVIPRSEGALGIDDGSVRDIALISRVGKPVCFVVCDIRKSSSGRYYALLSRKAAQKKCADEYLSMLRPGDVIPAKVSHMENFGVFCDIGTGINALLPIDSISVSRIPHPSARFIAGQDIKAVVLSKDGAGRITLTHKELLGTWDENVSRFKVGETVPGVVRSVESYGVFIELAPNLAGLAEFSDGIATGQSAAVYIKSINPQRMKIKLVIVDICAGNTAPEPEKYYFSGEHMDKFVYSPEECEKRIETVFQPQTASPQEI